MLSSVVLSILLPVTFSACPLETCTASSKATASSSGLSFHHTGFLCSESGEVCPPGPLSTIGAEVHGVHNFSKLSPSQIQEIRQALNKYKVLYFKDIADRTTPEDQLWFAEQFGTVYPEISTVPEYIKHGVHQSAHSARSRRDEAETHNQSASLTSMIEANEEVNRYYQGKKLPCKVARLVREPGDPYAFGEGWHADVTFYPEPPFFTFLMGRDMPGGGKDDTIFIDTQKAYQTLPPLLKKEITGLSAFHNDSAGLWDIHPMVRTHPENGGQGIYANSHFTHRVNGYSQEESEKLLDKIFDHIEDQPVFRFKWTGRHALLWDNRQLQHTATSEWAFDEVLGKKRRELHRIVISGDERPFYRGTRKKHFTTTTRA